MSNLDFRVFIEPQQGASYDQQLRLAKASEQAGYSAFFRSDHYLAMGDRDGLPGPTDSWVTLGGIARETSTIRLGTLVSSATFRHPGVLAIQVAQVDEMSSGRVDFGLGAGWYEEEHDAYAIPFLSTPERFDVFEEQLEIITGLWATPIGETFDFTGKVYTIADSPGLPKPAQDPRPPIIIGGQGKKRTPELTARFADEFNAGFGTPAEAAVLIERVRATCAEQGRDPDELTYSIAKTICVGRDEAQIQRRADNIGRSLENLYERGMAGTPDQVLSQINDFAEIGITRFYLQTLDVDDIDHIEYYASEVVPHTG